MSGILKYLHEIVNWGKGASRNNKDFLYGENRNPVELPVKMGALAPLPPSSDDAYD